MKDHLRVSNSCGILCFGPYTEDPLKGHDIGIIWGSFKRCFSAIGGVGFRVDPSTSDQEDNHVCRLL